MSIKAIYLASPYSDPDARVREARYQAACRATADLFRSGHYVFSPVAYSHPIAQHGLPLDWSFWEEFDRRLLAMSDELWVLKLPGWDTSHGVQAEIGIARSMASVFDTWILLRCRSWPHRELASVFRRSRQTRAGSCKERLQT